MKSIKISNLKSIFNRELNYLNDGISNGKNPYHFFYLSTIKDNSSESRTIVLRNINKEPFRIFFNADYRSPKVKQLLKNNECAALFYDNSRKVQIRLKCIATIFHNDLESKKIWDKTPLQSRKCYMGMHNPSKILNNYDPNIPTKYIKMDPEKDDSESGYKNFSYIQLDLKSVDILELHHDGHIRFQVDSDNNFSFIAF